MRKHSRLFLLALLFLLTAPAFSDVRVEWIGGEKLQRYFDSSTGETLNVIGGIFLQDDFIDTAANKTSSPGPWTFSVVNGASWWIVSATDGIGRAYLGHADDDDSEISQALTWSPGQWYGMEARVKVLQPTCAINIGISDALYEAADYLAIRSPATVTSASASNAALFFSDYDSTSNYWRCATVKADTLGTVTSTETAFAADTWHIFRVQTNPDGDVYFWFDGEHIKTVKSGINASVPVTPYIGVIARVAASNLYLDVDNIKCWQLRGN